MRHCFNARRDLFCQAALNIFSLFALLFTGFCCGLRLLWFLNCFQFYFRLFHEHQQPDVLC